MKPGSDGRDEVVADRRSHDRRPFDAVVRVLWAGGSIEPVQHRMDDFSLGGFRIRSSEPLRIGSRGFALKVLPEGSRLECWVEVVWCGPTKDDGAARAEEPFDVGVRFIADSQPLERPAGV